MRLKNFFTNSYFHRRSFLKTWFNRSTGVVAGMSSLLVISFLCFYWSTESDWYVFSSFRSRPRVCVFFPQHYRNSICRNSINKTFIPYNDPLKYNDTLKIHLYILRSVIIEFTTLYISLSPPVRTGRSRSKRTVTVECSPQVSQGSLFPLGSSAGSPWVIRGVFARGDSLGNPVSLSLHNNCCQTGVSITASHLLHLPTQMVAPSSGSRPASACSWTTLARTARSTSTNFKEACFNTATPLTSIPVYLQHK